jgi:DnaJ-class molecular chaperone
MQSVKQFCRQCAGKGKVGQKLCSSCDGTGTVTVLLPAGTCPRCQGSGRRYSSQRDSWDDCETCLGTGWVGTGRVAS